MTLSKYFRETLPDTPDDMLLELDAGLADSIAIFNRGRTPQAMRAVVNAAETRKAIADEFERRQIARLPTHEEPA